MSRVNILYSKENIKITLFYSENLENYENKKDLALLPQGRSKFLERGKENLLPPQKSKFVSTNWLPKDKDLRTFSIVLPI
ncbi:unnamed protein product [marine sediment metagenome]|uniref:Uncharacterized protein n=1 Tax=marine sediment metagenome TaxID=412755 RepID=X1BIF7_9ZZZZ